MSERRIEIGADRVKIVATLNQSATADALWTALPLTSSVQIWGNEIYSGITPNCCIIDMLSWTPQCSTIFPFATRTI